MTDNLQYKVLARKYRPATFNDLIGQEALVKTLANAIETGRLAQAYMLTGIRGVGKTTSARIIAKALNCVGPDGKGQMTTNPCGKCEHCHAIAEDRDVDVQEIDAASNTQVDNIREIIQAAKYNPVAARYKVYIIDEVHMLSKGAANALLKLLEEPPERLKFVFATTEIRRVPITILSRCQRFDLRRVELDELARYFKEIVKKENVTATDEAIDIVARCADGSVRDGLSLLDQAIALSAGNIDAEMVRSMLGLADKSMLFNLLGNLLQGKAKEVLSIVSEMRASSADALMILQDLLDLVYVLTKLKVVPDLVPDVAMSVAESVKAKELSGKLSMAVLTRLWQMLFKGLGEVRLSSASFTALEMVLLRVAYAYGVFTPADILKEIASMDDEVKAVTIPGPVSVAASPVVAPDTLVKSVGNVLDVKSVKTVGSDGYSKNCITSLKDVVDLLRKNGQDLLAIDVEKYLRLVAFDKKTIKVHLESGYPHDILVKLSVFLEKVVGEKFNLVAVEEIGEDTLKQQKDAATDKMCQELAKDPLAKATLDAFPGAKITKAVSVNVLGELDEDEETFDNNGYDDNGGEQDGF